MTRLLFALLLTAPLAGCGSSTSTTAPANTPSASEMFDKGKVPPKDPLGGAPKPGAKGQ